MEIPQDTFSRYEEKYLLSTPQYAALSAALTDRMRPDEFFKSTICNVYYDTPNYALIRASLDKPIYKEKFRLRSYGVPHSGSTVFLEIKKKFDGIVYKRRVAMTLAEAEAYLGSHVYPDTDSQILREIDWFRTFREELMPMVYLSYDRKAYVSVENPALRFTFDTNILWRQTGLSLPDGVGGASLLDDGFVLLEMKVPGALPLWFVKILHQINAQPTSFSKYGAAYQEILRRQLADRDQVEQGGFVCA